MEIIIAKMTTSLLKIIIQGTLARTLALTCQRGLLAGELPPGNLTTNGAVPVVIITEILLAEGVTGVAETKIEMVLLKIKIDLEARMIGPIAKTEIPARTGFLTRMTGLVMITGLKILVVTGEGEMHRKIIEVLREEIVRVLEVVPGMKIGQIQAETISGQDHQRSSPETTGLLPVLDHLSKEVSLAGVNLILLEIQLKVVNHPGANPHPVAHQKTTDLADSIRARHKITRLACLETDLLIPNHQLLQAKIDGLKCLKITARLATQVEINLETGRAGLILIPNLSPASLQHSLR